jgi:hypothetical protein
MCFKTKWGELSESTTISCSVEPLKETPQEAEWEELAQRFHLFSETVQKKKFDTFTCRMIIQLYVHEVW